ncbi:MAG: hypothetical protein M3Z75_27200 [Actinomycetota bacterium]|nr:hypothetical protein [Actinomycetota bacterium]
MQPGPELGLAAEPGDALPGGEERVLRVVVVMQYGQGDTVNPGGITAHELIEGLQITLLGPPDQLLTRSHLAGP